MFHVKQSTNQLAKGINQMTTTLQSLDILDKEPQDFKGYSYDCTFAWAVHQARRDHVMHVSFSRDDESSPLQDDYTTAWKKPDLDGFEEWRDTEIANRAYAYFCEGKYKTFDEFMKDIEHLHPTDATKEKLALVNTGNYLLDDQTDEELSFIWQDHDDSIHDDDDHTTEIPMGNEAYVAGGC